MIGMHELPITLGLCRDCSRLRVMNETTIEGAVLRCVYYCRARMRCVDGCSQCDEFVERT